MNISALARRLACAILSPALLALAPPAAAQAPATRPPITVASEEAFWWGDFAALERQNAYYKQPNRFDPDGASQLELFRNGLITVYNNKVTNAEAYLAEVDRLTLQWATAHPQSAIAHIVHARALAAHGWSWRGGGYAKDVPPDAWKEFQAYLLRAVNHLNTHAAVALTDSYAHLVLLKIGMGLGWDAQQLAAILEDGLKRNPEDYSLYTEMALALLPKWGGDADVLDSFIRHAATQAKERYGSGMYAELYWFAAENEFSHALFERSRADWPRMKAAYDDMFIRFPDNPVRLNRYAYMACLAKDKAVFTPLLAKLGDKVDTRQWGVNAERMLESCRRWAAQP